MTHGDTSWLSAPSSSRDDKSDDTQRPTWLSALFVKDSMSVDWDYFSFTSVNQRQASPLTRRDQYGHMHLFIEDSMSIDLDYFSLTFVIRRRQVWWHTKTSHGYPHLRQPEASEPVDTQGPMWSSTPFVEDSMYFYRDYCSLHFVNQRQASLLTCKDCNSHLV